jgi:hypothetical protein
MALEEDGCAFGLQYLAMSADVLLSMVWVGPGYAPKKSE